MKRHRHKARGAVLVEFVIAFVPFTMLFFAATQYSVCAVEKILTKHAAFLAARAAIVACTEPGKAEGGEEEMNNAAALAFGPALKLGHPSAEITAGACEQTSQEMLTVKVTMPMRCGVPLGNILVCGGTTKTLTASASMPSQGTYANKLWGEEGGGE